MNSTKTIRRCRVLALGLALCLPAVSSDAVFARSLAQQTSVIVTGTVVDPSGAPIVGASVIQVGTTNAVVTDADGRYRLSVSDAASTLEFFFVGFAAVHETVGSRTVIDVTMNERITALDDVVVIGYGTTTKREITGSVASLSSDEFKSGNVTDVMQLLQGQVAGLNIVRADGGNPNSDLQVQLRGLSAMSTGAGPLVVIDGTVGGDLNSVSPDNIASIDVLKDGSAAAIYGTRGTNGVILITTKKAEMGVSKIEFNVYTAVQTVDRKPEMLTADGFREALTKFGGSEAADHGASTDWFDQITRKPVSQMYSLATSGGTGKLNYRLSASWNKDEGLVKKSSNERLRTRLNVTQTLLNDRLKIDYTANYMTSRSSYADNYIMRQAMFHNPTEPVYARESDPESAHNGPYYFVNAMEYYNPVAMLDQRDDSSIRRQFSGSVNASLSITDHLKAGALASFTETGARYGHYYGRYHPQYQGKNGQSENFNDHSAEKMLETTLDYSNKWGGHKLQAIAGYSFSSGWDESYEAMNYLFDTDLYSFYNIGAGNALQEGKATMGSYKESNTLVSFFGRAMYNYKEKYLLSASLRREGSSRFGDNYKWGYFPAVSVGWRLTEEPFMKGVEWLDNFKLRAGFGVTGNQNFSSYRSLSLLSKGSSSFYYNGGWLSTYAPSQNHNPDLRWERKAEVNVGFDASMLDDRLSVGFDWYNRTTRDMLYTYAVPVPPNLYGYTFANVGTMVNKGVELTVSGKPIVTKNFRWNVTLSMSRNTNNLKSFSNDTYEMDYLDTGYFGDDLKIYTMRIEEGGSIGNFYGPEFVGYDTAGKALYRDGETGAGVPQSEITQDDYRVIGNAYPDALFSLHNTFNYKNFDLSFLFRGALGNDVLNMTELYYGGANYLGTKNVLASALDSKYDYTEGVYYSSRVIEDGTYVKLDNITLGYTVPLRSLLISRLRFYVTGQNLLTITGYKGIDPEVNISGLAPGIESYSFYPRTKTFVLGVNLTF